MKVLEVILSLSKCTNKKYFIRCMRDLFQFPSYFGGNLDSVDECMRDLSWLEEDVISIKVIDFNKAKKENGAAVGSIIDILRSYETYWNSDKTPHGKRIILHIVQ